MQKFFCLECLKIVLQKQCWYGAVGKNVNLLFDGMDITWNPRTLLPNKYARLHAYAKHTRSATCIIESIYSLSSWSSCMCNCARFLSNYLQFKEYFVSWQILYELGARKFLLNGIGPLGCTPGMINSTQHEGECVEFINKVVNLYNVELSTKLLYLQSQLPGSLFTHSDNFQHFQDMKESHETYGNNLPCVHCDFCWFCYGGKVSSFLSLVLQG